MNPGSADPQIVDDKQWTLSVPSQVPSGCWQNNSQTAAIHFVAAYQVLYDDINPERSYLWVSLQGTTVAADINGTIVSNTSLARGWYLDQTRLAMSVGPDASSFKQIQVSPTTSECTGTLTSSVGVNAGTFGAALTPGVSFNSSYSMSISNTQIVDNSQDQVLQYYNLSSTANGAPYSSPGDLHNYWSMSDSTALFGLPLVAMNNLNILTQAIWAVPDDFSESTVPLTVSFLLRFQHFTAAEAIKPSFSLSSLVSMPPPPAPLSSTSYQSANWTISIPFKRG